MKFIIIFLLLISGSATNAQFLTQSTEGKSSIPLPLKGLGLSFDVGKTEVAFGLNNYGRVFDSVKNQCFIGVNITAKNKSGLGKLFNAGDIVGEGDLLLFAGYSRSNTETISNKYDTSSLFIPAKAMADSMEKINWHYRDKVLEFIPKHEHLIKDTVKRNEVTQDLRKQLSDLKLDEIFGINNLIANYRPFDDELEMFRGSLLADDLKARKHFGSLTTKVRIVRDSLRKVADSIFSKSVTPWRLTIFGQGGIKAREFKRYLGLSLPDFNKSFQDTLFRGGHFGLGVNFQISKFWLGLTYSYVKTDNFSFLTSKEYTIRRTDTSAPNVFIQEKKITAYPGKYSRVELNELNVDLIIDFKLKGDTSRILVNPYLRASLFSRDTAFIKNYTNIGLGLYFLGRKRKFIGGLYVELPDINNNAEKAKPADEIHIQPPFKKLSFGIVTKFNISSFFNFTNRAAKPD